jgi:TRAP-type C4-dicarboxylate transport system substrate-binding protein
VPDVLASLQTGVINAAYGSPYSMIALQWHSKVKYMTAAKISIGIGATVVTKKAFDKLTPGDQQIVRETAFAAAAKLVNVIRKDNTQAEGELSRAGIQKVQTPAPLLGEMQKAAGQVKQEMIGKLYPASLLQQVEQALSEYRSGAR